ncbi:MAG: DUF4380 domain-containing protein [Melioribacteraceae bacterium]|nr:DUF4380 domain-containing protein [Melioribacteraceae bacterium]
MKNNNNYSVILLVTIMFICGFMLSGCANKAEHLDPERSKFEKIKWISGGKTKVGIFPEAGGRIVAVHRNGGENILKSDSKLWNYEFDKPVDERIYNKKLPFNGHIVWVGPQTDWWTQQDVIPELASNESRWPPDPYLIYGDHLIDRLTDKYAKIISPKSKYTGLQLKKTITVDEDGIIRFNVEAENIRDEEVAWDLWLNTRMDGFTKVYVAVESETDIRMEYRLKDKMQKMPHKINKGYFYFDPQFPSDGNMRRLGKALIHPSVNKLFAFTDEEMFVIRFKKYDRSLTHSEHGMIEIYNTVSSDGNSLLELEYHSPYKKLKPTEKMSSKETWKIVEYRGINRTEEHIKFIQLYRNLNRNLN